MPLREPSFTPQRPSATMGIEPPFIYSRPPSYRFETESTERGFNPRAATDAAWADAQRVKEKRASQLSRQGPLVDRNELNKHPDSYMVIPSTYLNFKPFNPRVKTAIIWLRYIQLALRVISLIGSVGLLVVLIFIKTTGESSDWILRIPPGIAILHNLYAVWHFSKKAAARTPGSSQSYCIFACIFDLGLIPFMIYTTLDVRNEWLLVQDNVDGHWTTLFGDGYGWPLYTTQATWLASASLGCIWVVTFCINVFLAVQFKRIADLPPDMNPLEQNLTSRSNSKHEKTKSTITQVTETESNRDSMASLLPGKGPQVPWMHTRNGSTTSLGTSSPPRSPRHSRYESTDSLTPPRSPYKPTHSGAGSPRSSTASLNTTHRRHGHQRQDSTGDLLPPNPHRNSNPPSPYRSSQNSPTRSSALRHGNTRNESPAPRSIYHSARGSQSTLHLDSNQPASSEISWPLSPPLNEGSWLSSASSNHDGPVDQSLVPKPLDATPPEFRHLRDGSATAARHAAERPYVVRMASKYDYSSRSPKPLGMNPPTPPVDPAIAAQAAENANASYKSNRASRANKARSALQPSGGAANRGYIQVNLEEDQDDWVENFHQQFSGDKKEDKKQVLQSKWSPGQKKPRVISSGFEEQGLRQGAVRERQVSGKVVEETQRGMQALRAEMGWA